MIGQTTTLSSLVRASRHSAFACKYLQTSSFMQQQATAATAETIKPPFQETKSVSEIPGPKRLPFLKSVHVFFDREFDNTKIHLFWKKLIADYGPTVRIDLPGMPPFVAVTTPEDCEKVARGTMDNPVREGFFSLAKIRKDAVDNYFEQNAGILAENHEEWWRVRSRVQTQMLKPKNVTSYLTSMDQVALEFMEKIAQFQKECGEMPQDFQHELYKWALESVGLVALNRRLGCLEPNLTYDSVPMTLIREANNMFSALNDTEISAGLWKIYPTKAYKKLKKSHEAMLRVADENIRDTEARLLARKEMESDTELTLMETLLMTPGLSRKDVITMILDMLFAGIDTTSHTIGFTLYLLSRNPQCQAKLQEEIDTVTDDHKGPLTTKHMAQLSYLKAVVKESLRLFPLTIGNVRTLQQDMVLSGYEVPKGFAVLGLNMFIGQNEEYFPRSEEFVPERWLRHKPLGPIHPYASLPFGMGTRMCIGRRIAEQEIYTLLTRAMQRYTVDYKYKDMDVVTRMVFIPSEPLRFSFTERR